jgi:formate dehydrogenase accessory protein FdhD
VRDVLSDALATVQALRVQGDARDLRDDSAVVEAPVALLYNGLSFAVMMATPCDLEDFALGFALSEGVVESSAEFRLVDVVRGEAGSELHAAIPQARYDALLPRRRNLEGRSGCGLCGVEALQDARRTVPRVEAPREVSMAQVQSALEALAQQQPLNARSGGVHAAGFMHAGGLLVREDVGRHNALDKLIGAMVHADVAPAPTDLAIRTAEAAGITLAAFARGDALNLYAHPHRLA